MSLMRTLILACSFLFLVPSPALAGDGTWSPRDVEKLRAVTSAALSPDGKHVAYALAVPRIAGTDEDGGAWVELHVLDTKGGSTRPFVGGKVNVGAFEWLPDGSGIAYLAKRDGDKHTALYTIALAGGESRKRVALETSIAGFSLAPDSKRVALVAPPPDDADRKKLVEKGFKQVVYEEDQPRNTVWIADLSEEGPSAEDAEPRQLEIEGHVHRVRWSPVDERLAISTAPTPLVDDQYMRQRVRVVDVEDGRLLARIENPGKLGEFTWSPDGKWIATILAQDVHDPSAGRIAVWSSGGDAELPESIAPLPGDWAADVTDAAFSGASSLMLCVHRGVEAAIEKVGFWDAASSEYKTIQPAGLAVFTSISLSTDGQHAAFVASRPDHPPEVYTMSHGDEAAQRRTDSNPWTKDMRFARQEVVRFKARDGLELEGILIHRLEGEGTPGPLVLSVHGGPEAHESNGWLTNYSRPGQMAAALGMAVFYPNYRGSTGRGVAFSKLSQGDAAGAEFDDLVDAVDHLVALGVADKDKVGITGGSYGGYATAWCSTKHSARFAAGVMFVGISDKISKIGSTDIAEEDFLVHSLERVWDKLDFYRERSPITYAHESRTPLLILHGRDDPRVDVSQSKTMYRWLKLRGQAPVRFVQYPGEGHGNRKACARLDYSVRMLRWLDHWLNARGREVPAWNVAYDLFEEEEPETSEPELQDAGAGQGG